MSSQQSQSNLALHRLVERDRRTSPPLSPSIAPTVGDTKSEADRSNTPVRLVDELEYEGLE
ncbi:hypothetical protein GMOD_00002639 [Pyrenophora seminiperda CCB06]|uniref:Uncharacterized protein n=1 Tax=Pyrenophora seminiperda CCB06 TaxID=1302712 RepID=A0A3M7M2T1_9PLEO|nr:hypothetical protein GMOD_00002639 [Pyrenophora seminiperda CCB06]